MRQGMSICIHVTQCNMRFWQQCCRRFESNARWYLASSSSSFLM